MMDLDDVLKLFDGIDEIAGTETIGLEKASGRVISHDIISAYDFPPYDRSAMDGFAFKYDDVAGMNSPVLKIVGEVYAGKTAGFKYGRGECVRIMTGGVVPEGLDTVAEFEICTEENGNIRIPKLPKKFSNIAFRGEDLKKGEIAFKKGTLIRSNSINLLGSLGMKKIEVKRMMKIGVLSTGDELVDVSEEIENGKIRDSSKYSLETQINGVHQEYIDLGIAKDDENEIKNRIKRAFKFDCDMVLVIGGSSVGDKDFTPAVFESLGSHIVVNKIAIKPGMPTIISMLEIDGLKKWIIGMPGNPVSTFISFEMIVLPLIEKSLGTRRLAPVLLNGKIKGRFSKKPGRIHFMPCNVSNGLVEPVKYNGSGDFTSLSKANAFFVAPKESSEIKDGENVRYFFI